MLSVCVLFSCADCVLTYISGSFFGSTELVVFRQHYSGQTDENIFVDHPYISGESWREDEYCKPA